MNTEDRKELITDHRSPTTAHSPPLTSPCRPILLGVGAAFDIHAGLKSDSPDWVKQAGLQWLHRLCQEPGRLWRRYLFIVPTFLVLVLGQLLGLRRYEEDA